MTNIADANTNNQLSRYEKTMAVCFALGLAAGPVAPAVMGIALVIGVLMLFRYAWNSVSMADIKDCLASPMGILMSLAMVWFFISSGFSLDPAKSFQVSARTTFVFFVATIFYLVFQRKLLLAKYLIDKLALVFGIWVLAASMLVMWRVYGFEPTILTALIVLKNDASLAILLLPVFLIAGFKNKGLMRIIMLLFFCFAGMLAFGYGADELRNKSGLFAAAISAIIVVVYWITARVQIRLRQLCFSLLFIASVVSLVAVMGKLPELGDLNASPPAATLPVPDHHRQVIWSFVIDHIWDRPVVGYGIDSAKLIPGANTRIIELANQEYVPAHPHNWILEIAVETGIPSVMFVLGTVLAAFLMILRIKISSRQEKENLAALVFILVAFCAVSLVSYSIWTVWWLVDFAFIFALLRARLDNIRSAHSTQN
ncbi:MAG: O-antigen ligase family protein [Alphaproteobacteria bacterium]|nr:O-antigen ligase family protein [Alphaproteobacteria bacterium]